jgi:hypothetical protein
MRLLPIAGLAIATVVLLAGPTPAQTLGTGIPLNAEDAKSPEQIAKQRQIESDYKATMKKIPDAKADDPWGNMRSADTGTQAKQPKPKTAAPKKTGSAVN